MNQPIAYITLNFRSILLFSLSTLVRSLGVLYSLLFGIPLLISLYDNLFKKK